MRPGSRMLALLFASTLACANRADTYVGASAEIDASAGDACPTTDTARPSDVCVNDDECVAFFRASAPSGTLFATCFQNRCTAAERCVVPNAGSTSYCVCGELSSVRGCIDSVCVRSEAAATADCAARTCGR